MSSKTVNERLGVNKKCTIKSRIVRGSYEFYMWRGTYYYEYDDEGNKILIDHKPYRIYGRLS